MIKIGVLGAGHLGKIHIRLLKEIDKYELIEDARTLPLEQLVKMKLTSFRRKDQVHLLDMISIGLIDESWLDRMPHQLRIRLDELLNDPDG